MYATADDLIARYDSRTVADLATDTGTPAMDLPNDPNVTAALEGASGAINAAVRAGDMYQVEDLEALQGDDAAYLKDLTCDLAMARLIKRRPEKYGDTYKDMVAAANDALDNIRGGAIVFPVPANIAAGKPTINGPSSVDYRRLNMLPDRTRNFYPNRQQRLPLGR